MKAIKIIEPILQDFYSVLQYNNWKPSNDVVCTLLESMLEKENIEFDTSTALDRDFKFIKEAGFCTDTHGTIDIGINKNVKVSLYLWRNRNCLYDFQNNRFLRELVVAISHELKHREQWQQGRFIKEDVKFTTIEDYYAHPNELEAFAYEAAMENLLGLEPTAVEIYRTYFPNGEGVFQEFMSKYKEFTCHEN